MNGQFTLPVTLDPRTILEATADSVFTIDRSWRFTYLNRRSNDLLARGRDLLGADLWEAFPEVGETKFADLLRAAMAGEVPSEVEEFYPPFNAWYSATAFPLPDGVAVFFRDTTAKRASNLALAQNEMRFRAMFETLTQGIVFQDGQGRVVDANPAAERILGMSREQMMGGSSRDAHWKILNRDGSPLRPEDYAGAISLATGQIIRGRVMGVFNQTLQEYRWLLVDTIPQFRPGEDKPYQVCALFNDITEHSRAINALKASQTHLASAQRVASVGSAEVDFRTGKWLWSDETYRIHGQDKPASSPLIDMPIDVVHEEDRDRWLHSVELARSGVTPPPIEYRILRPDGKVRTIYGEAELITDELGTVVGALITQRDVTDIRLAERQREELHKQLLQAQRVEALGVLAGGIAHDLNNTLVPILGLSDLVLKELPEGADTRDAMETIRDAGLKARDLVRQILAFSRGDSPNRAPLALRPFFKSTMRLVRASIPTTIKIQERIEDVPMVFADAGQLHQVIVNLATNASHAIGDRIGSIAIEVAFLGDETQSPRNSDPPGWVRMSVIDTGCGMDEVTQRRIFEPFFTTREIGKGTGLGLSVAHGIIKAHGGRIEVKSSPGQGSRLDIYLPAHVPQVDAQTDKSK